MTHESSEHLPLPDRTPQAAPSPEDWQVRERVHALIDGMDAPLKKLYVKNGEKTNLQIGDAGEIIIELESDFRIDVPDEEVRSMRTVGQLIDLVVAKMGAVPKDGEQAA